jgi:hypothetical protein
VIDPATAGETLRRMEEARQRASFTAGRGNAPAASTWTPLPLGPVIKGERLDEPPALLARSDGIRLLYRERVHALSGEPESGKGWLALTAAAERLAAGEDVLYFDFEDTATSIASRLLALGVDAEAITTRFHYVRPDEPLKAGGWEALDDTLTAQPTLAVIDGVTEALVLHALDLKDNADVAKWLALLPRKLVEAGMAVLQIDHVGRDKEARGRFALGAQHKLAGIDVAYSLEVIDPFGRGRDGRVKVTITKDRPGHIRQHADESKRVAELRLTSQAEGAVSIELAPPGEAAGAPAGPFRPTTQMERVSRAVEEFPGLTKNSIRSSVTGKNEFKDLALDLLVTEGYVRAERDGQASRHHPIRPFREAGAE